MQQKFSIALFLYSRNKSYGNLLTLASAVYKGLVSNSTYPSPIPDMVSFGNQIQTMNNRLSKWAGGKGSKADLARLKTAADTIRISLKRLAEYVMSTTPNTPESWIAVGFSIKSAKRPLGSLQVVQSFHQVISPRIGNYFIRLKWQKPLDSQRVQRIKYRVLRNGTEDFDTAKQIAIVSKTSFEERSPSARGAYYWIIPLNSDGSDAVCSHYLFAAPRISAPL